MDDAVSSETEPDIGWGLGWGVEPNQHTFFQWGKMSGVRAFVMGSVIEQASSSCSPIATGACD